jgi:hypothetical protein
VSSFYFPTYTPFFLAFPAGMALRLTYELKELDE